MNAPYFEERINPTERDTTSPVVNSDVFADQIPVDAALVHETPMGGTVAAVGPLNEFGAAEFPMNPELRADAIPMYETPVTETVVSETVISANSMYDLHTDAVPMYETPVKEFPATGTAVPVELKDEAIPYQAPLANPMVQETAVVASAASAASPASAVPLAPLLTHEDSEHFRTHWNEIQGKFVDDPRTAVQQADTLVSEVVAQITQMFATEHSSLESQWNQGNDVSTEDLRKALQRYRSFFNRLMV